MRSITATPARVHAAFKDLFEEVNGTTDRAGRSMAHASIETLANSLLRSPTAPA